MEKLLFESSVVVFTGLHRLKNKVSLLFSDLVFVVIRMGGIKNVAIISSGKVIADEIFLVTI